MVCNFCFFLVRSMGFEPTPRLGLPPQSSASASSATTAAYFYITIISLKNQAKDDEEFSGASEGNRTPNSCLGSNSFTIKLHLQKTGAVDGI